jgi:hypothetical protein
MFITGVNDTGEKLFSGVNDTGEKFIASVINPCHGFSVIAGVNDTGDKFIAGVVDTAEQLFARDNDTGDKFIAGDKNKDAMEVGCCKDRKKLKGINRRYLLPPKSATATNGVIGNAMKSCIHKHPTHLDQRPLRPPNLYNAVLVCSSFGGLRGF